MWHNLDCSNWCPVKKNMCQINNLAFSIDNWAWLLKSLINLRTAIKRKMPMGWVGCFTLMKSSFVKVESCWFWALSQCLEEHSSHSEQLSSATVSSSANRWFFQHSCAEFYGRRQSEGGIWPLIAMLCWVWHTGTVGIDVQPFLCSLMF